MRRWGSWLMVMGCWSGLVWASVGLQAAEEVVRQTTSALFSLLDSEASILADQEKLQAAIHDIVVPHIAFDEMSKRVLGVHWRTASEQQQADFTRDFAALVVRTYSAALDSYHQTEIDYLPGRTSRSSDSKVEIRTVVRPSGQPSIPINYRMMVLDDTWKVYDINIDGVSMVASFKSQFDVMIARQGLSGLIEDIRQRNGLNAGVST